MVGHFVDLTVDWLASMHIGTHHLKHHRIGLESLTVEVIDIGRDIMIGIIGTDEITSLDEVAHTHVFRVVAQ